jgi:hypothetical protein
MSLDHMATTVGSYRLCAGLTPEQRSVVSLGACTRNLCAALTPLLAVNADSRTTVMIAFGVPIHAARDSARGALVPVAAHLIHLMESRRRPDLDEGHGTVEVDPCPRPRWSI